MNRLEYFKKIMKGVIFALVITISLVFILSLVMTFMDISIAARNVSSVVITCLSVFLGTVYASRSINKKGWLTGIVVAVGYVFCLFIIYAALNKQVTFTNKDLYRLILAITVGALSGMLGINM